MSPGLIWAPDRWARNYASLKIKVKKKKVVSRHPLLAGLYKNIPSSTQTLFRLYNKAHRPPSWGRLSTACVGNAHIHMGQLYFCAICIWNQHGVCQFGSFWWTNLFHCIAALRNRDIYRNARGGIGVVWLGRRSLPTAPAGQLLWEDTTSCFSGSKI